MFDGQFYDSARDRVTFNHPQIVKALEWMAGWAQRAKMDQANQQLRTGGNWLSALANGTLAFHPLVSTNVPTVGTLNASVQLGHGLLPASPPGQAGAVWTGCWSLASVPGSRRREDAWEFMRWTGATPEGTLSAAKHTGGLPGFAKSPGFDHLAKDPNMVAHVEAARRAKFLRPEFYAPVEVDYAKLNDALKGPRAPRAVLDELTEQTQQKLQEFRAQQKR